MSPAKLNQQKQKIKVGRRFEEGSEKIQALFRKRTFEKELHKAFQICQVLLTNHHLLVSLSVNFQIASYQAVKHQVTSLVHLDKRR